MQLRESSKWLQAPIRRSRAPVNIYAQRDGIMREREMSGTKLWEMGIAISPHRGWTTCRTGVSAAADLGALRSLPIAQPAARHSLLFYQIRIKQLKRNELGVDFWGFFCVAGREGRVWFRSIKIVGDEAEKFTLERAMRDFVCRLNGRDAVPVSRSWLSVENSRTDRKGNRPAVEKSICMRV